MATFNETANVYFGNQALREAMPMMKKLGTKALIVTGQHVAASSMMEDLKNLLCEFGFGYFVYDEIAGEPTVDMIEKGIKEYNDGGCDFCIGIGGGSPMDSAKAISFFVKNAGLIASYNGTKLTGSRTGVVCIPTTAGTGSETTKFVVITDTESGVKMLLKGDVLIPDIAVINPSYTKGAPKSITAATGMDALTHAVEAYTSKKAMPLTDPLAIDAVKKIMKYLPEAYENPYDYEARSAMAVAAFEAGVCINNSSVTLVHGMSRPIGAMFHVSHGLSNAMLLKDCLSFALDGAFERFADLGRAVGVAKESDSDVVIAEKFISAIQELCAIIEIPTLREYGIDSGTFLELRDKMAFDALVSGSPANTRKPVTIEDMKKIYKRVIEE